MGIGLSVSRSIVERHDGRLWAEPNDGLGATFSFPFPAGQTASRIRHPNEAFMMGRRSQSSGRQYQSLIDRCRLSGASFNDDGYTRNEDS